MSLTSKLVLSPLLVAQALTTVRQCSGDSWHASDPLTGTVLAFVFGRPQDDVFLALKQWVEPFGAGDPTCRGFPRHVSMTPPPSRPAESHSATSIEPAPAN